MDIKSMNTTPLKIAAWCFIVSPIITPAIVIAPIALYLERQNLALSFPGHYEFLMRTFWIALIGLVLVALASTLGGPLGFVIWVVWIVGRGWVTLTKLGEGQDQPDPKHLWWG